MKILLAGQLVVYEVGLARDGRSKAVSIFACLIRNVARSRVPVDDLRSIGRRSLSR